MTTSKFLPRYVIFLSIGVFFACASPGGNMPIAQTGAKDSGIDQPVTSAPGDTHGSGKIDYENAQPMPMPSLPAPPPSDNLPIPPAGGGSMGQPGHSPSGSHGTGEQDPRVLFPPKSLPGTQPADDTSSEDEKPQ